MLASTLMTVPACICQLSRMGWKLTMLRSNKRVLMHAHSPDLAGSSALLTMPNCCEGAAGKPVSVLFAGKSAEALQDPAVAQLSRWGYPVPSCVEALQRLKGSPDAAHQDLFARLSGQSSLQQQTLRHVIQCLWNIRVHSLVMTLL